MFDAWQMATLIIVLLLVVFSGVHIAVALGITAALGIYLMQGDIEVVRIFIANTAYEALRDYVFAVIPLFMLMGEFLAKCGAATDLFALINRLTRRVPGRLGIATVFANALFAFVTGVSIAAAAAFHRSRRALRRRRVRQCNASQPPSPRGVLRQPKASRRLPRPACPPIRRLLQQNRHKADMGAVATRRPSPTIYFISIISTWVGTSPTFSPMWVWVSDQNTSPALNSRIMALPSGSVILRLNRLSATSTKAGWLCWCVFSPGWSLYSSTRTRAFSIFTLYLSPSV